VHVNRRIRSASTAPLCCLPIFPALIEQPAWQGVFLSPVDVKTVSAGDRELDSGLAIESSSVVFTFPQRDPYDLTNLYWFSHAPSVLTPPVTKQYGEIHSARIRVLERED
jgi:hypothetical protein